MTLRQFEKAAVLDELDVNYLLVKHAEVDSSWYDRALQVPANAWNYITGAASWPRRSLNKNLKGGLQSAGGQVAIGMREQFQKDLKDPKVTGEIVKHFGTQMKSLADHYKADVNDYIAGLGSKALEGAAEGVFKSPKTWLGLGGVGVATGLGQALVSETLRPSYGQQSTSTTRQVQQPNRTQQAVKSNFGVSHGIDSSISNNYKRRGSYGDS